MPVEASGSPSVEGHAPVLYHSHQHGLVDVFAAHSSTIQQVSVELIAVTVKHTAKLDPEAGSEWWGAASGAEAGSE